MDGAAVEEQSADDEAMAADVARYFERNAKRAPWYGEIEAIRVEDGVIRIETRLEVAGADRRAVTEICSLIQGSDVADFTPGHSVSGSGDTLVTCPPRRDR